MNPNALAATAGIAGVLLKIVEAFSLKPVSGQKEVSLLRLRVIDFSALALFMGMAGIFAQLFTEQPSRYAAVFSFMACVYAFVAVVSYCKVCDKKMSVRFFFIVTLFVVGNYLTGKVLTRYSESAEWSSGFQVLWGVLGGFLEFGTSHIIPEALANRLL